MENLLLDFGAVAGIIAAAIMLIQLCLPKIRELRFETDSAIITRDTPDVFEQRYRKPCLRISFLFMTSIPDCQVTAIEVPGYLLSWNKDKRENFPLGKEKLDVNFITTPSVTEHQFSFFAFPEENFRPSRLHIRLKMRFLFGFTLSISTPLNLMI